VDVLGTWPAWQHLGLNEAGSALRPQETLWHSVAGDTPEEYHILTVIAPLPVTLQDGTQTTLAVDTRLWATATDEKSVVHFATADGRRGTIAVAHDDQVWYWRIDGKNEQDYFSPLPYAG